MHPCSRCTAFRNRRLDDGRPKSLRHWIERDAKPELDGVAELLVVAQFPIPKWRFGADALNRHQPISVASRPAPDAGDHRAIGGDGVFQRGNSALLLRLHATWW